MLRFVLGRSGYGKSEYLRRLFADRAREGDGKLLFIVPDQISFETEAAFLDMLGPSLSREILVLGFSRLCDYVFEATGNRFLSFADDGIRNMVISLAIEQVKDGLKVFDRRSDTPDTREIMLSAVKEYKKCSIDSAALYRTAETMEDESLSGKLADTALIYDAYNAIMERSYMDPLDSLTKVAYLLSEHKLFEGYTVALDGFYGFTAQEYDVIERLMDMSGEMYVALTDDSRDDSSQLFYSTRRTRSRLTCMAKDRSVDIAPIIRLDIPRRFSSPSLIALEESIYRIDKDKYEDEASDVTVYRASDIYDECDFVARTIRSLVKDGYRYRDMAVISRSGDQYLGILDTYFDKYDIRYFMDKPQDIDSMPLVRLISSAFDIITRGFDREDVLTLLKTGLCSYGIAEVAEFENYLFVWDISGSRFFDEFKNAPSGFADEMSDADIAQLGRIEALRADIIGKLRRFGSAVKDTDGRGISKALMKLLYDLDCDDNIGALCDKLESEGEHDAASDLIRMWNVLCEILDKIVAVIGDYSVSAKRFSELLRTDLLSSEVSVIPRGLDEVDVSTADRSLISDKKIVFVIGALDGEFPRVPVEAGVFTDDERVRLRDTFGLPLSDSVEELIAAERYYAYSALTAAGERLYVSFASANIKGEALTPSDMVSELSSVLPRSDYINFDEVPVEERLGSKRAAFDYLVRRYRSISPDILALKAYFTADEEYGDILRSVEDILSRRVRRIKDRELARRLFGDSMKLSSTKIDVYHKCPFRYFCEYGLRVGERRKAAVDALEYGTLMHYIFESFFGGYSRDEYTAMDEPQVADIISDILDEYTVSHFGGLEDKSGRFIYLLMRTKSTAVKLVLHMIEELRHSDFIPVDFELGVGEDIPAYNVELGDGLSLTVRGSVDRVDRCDADGVSYIRVVDYKTGTKDFNINDILYGLNLQMFIYMYAIRENGGDRYGEITPAGVLYMPAVSPTVSADPDTPEDKLQKELMKKYAMKGVVLNSADIIEHMEHGGRGVYIPAKLKDGAVAASSDSLATLEQLGAIFRRIDVLTSQMALSLYDGDVAAKPLKGDRYDGCAYCAYRSVCLREDDDPCREAETKSADEVYDELMREGDRDGAQLD
ncbi:MAG: PD-(D/E)XK nuclease family protein [Ruminococcus sp.]|nr:PD-(D/E)XK nuclease family protein [Ruminococcus sp.]